MASQVSPGIELLPYIDEVILTKLMADHFNVLVYRSKAPGIYARLDDMVVHNLVTAFSGDLETIYAAAKAA